MKDYRVPDNTSIGHVHLKVSDLNLALDFYCNMLGFELMQTYGSDAAFISAGGYHHHIGLNTWYSKNGPRPARNASGLFHTAIRYPQRSDLARIYKRLSDLQYPFTGFADHGVSEAVYLDDPDGNGVELYWDRPRSEWPRKSDGSIDMFTKPLDLVDLLDELNNGR